MTSKQQNMLIGTVLLLIIIAIFSYKYWQPNPGRAARLNIQQTATSLPQAWQQLRSANSVHLATNLDITLPHNTTQQISNQPVVQVTIKTEGDTTWAESLTYAGNFRIETQGRGMQLFTDGDIYMLPDKTIFKLHNLPTLLNPSGNLLEKWTGVGVPLFNVSNTTQVNETLENFFTTSWTSMGPDSTNFSWQRFEKTISADEAQSIQSVFTKQASGSQALHVIARLLKNFTVEKIQAWVTPNSSLARLEINFAHQTNQEQKATLIFTFSDEGKPVTIEAPTAEVTVKPEIFIPLLGEPQPKPSPTPTPTPKR